MRAIRTSLIRVLIGLGIIFCIICIHASVVTSAESNQKPGDFTAVAGTESVVIDKRAQNNTMVASLVVFSAIVVLGAMALSHIKSKQKLDIK